MSVLVTGGAGYIGSHAVRALCDQGEKVFVVDNLSRGFRQAVDKRAEFFAENIQNKEFVSKLIRDQRIQSVLHFAAFIDVAESVREPDLYFQNNFENAKALVDTCMESGVESFIFSSTAATYGSPKTIPIPEEHITEPINPYGESKRKLEIYLQKSSLRHIIFRYFNVAGAHESGEIGEAHDPETHLIPNIIKSSQNADFQLKVFGTDYDTTDGTCVRDYVHVMDLVNAHLLGLKKMEQLHGSIINLGSESGFSVLQVIQAAEKSLGRKIAYEVSDRRPGDPPTLLASNERAKNLLGWKLEHPKLEQMISSAARWHRNQPTGYPKV